MNSEFRTFKVKLAALFLAAAGVVLSSFPLLAVSKIDIGAEYRLRNVSLSNPTYASEQPAGTDKVVNYDYYSHRARVYLKGKLEPGIEIGSVIQSIGVGGSTAAVLNRYPKEDLSPFIENMYVQANSIRDWPLNLTVGRQPFVWGSGLLIADDGMGFDAIRVEAGPFWNMKFDFFTAKPSEGAFSGKGDKDLNLAGISYNWGIHNIKIGYIMEDDRSNTLYSYMGATNPVASDRIKRTYLDFQFSGNLEKGAFYRAEYVRQSGQVNLPGEKQVELAANDNITFEGGFDFTHPRYKRMVLAFVFMQGTGDDVTTKDVDERFRPSYGHRYDGLEYAGAGELFAATPYSFANDDKLQVPIRAGDKVVATHSFYSLFSGVRTFGFRGSVNPYPGFVAGLEYYLYTAREIPDIRNGSPTTVTDNSLGRELVISAQYTYAKRLLFSVRWGKYFASENTNNLGASRLMFEATGRF